MSPEPLQLGKLAWQPTRAPQRALPPVSTNKSSSGPSNQMEDPQPCSSTHHHDRIQPTQQPQPTPSVLSSPEHSRSRSKKIRAANQLTGSGRPSHPRRRESYADGTRRGRSRTRSISPGSVKHRATRRRRSRSPSRSCSTTATETQSSDLKRCRRSGKDQSNDERTKTDVLIAMARDDSRESMRSRSKRRKKYRRKSDYTSTAGDVVGANELRTLRGLGSMGLTALNGEVLDQETARDIE